MAESTKTLRAAFGETDAAGIVYYPNYLRWFDQASHDLFGRLGYSSGDLLRQGVTMAVIEVHARYHAALAFEDEITITSRVSEVRIRALRIEHTVRRGDQVVCEGYEVRMWVRVSAEDGRLQPDSIPDDLRAALAS